MGSTLARRAFVRTGSRIVPVLREQNIVIEYFNPQRLRRFLYGYYGIMMPRWVDDVRRPEILTYE